MRCADGAASDSSEDPIHSALHQLIDPWELDPAAAAASSDIADAEAWFQEMDPVAIATASEARAKAFAELDAGFEDSGDDCIMLKALHDPSSFLR